MNPIKIEYQYRFLDCPECKHIPLLILHFKGTELNSDYSFYEMNLGQLMTLEIKKIIIKEFPNQLVFCGSMLGRGELKIFLNLFCLNTADYMIQKCIKKIGELEILCEPVKDDTFFDYNHENYCFEKNKCYFNNTVCRIQQLREEILSSEKQSFFLVYQPKINVENEKIHSFEVLTRWEHSDYGQLSPVVFLKVIKQMGYQYEFDLFIIEKSCQEVKEFLEDVDNFSVNISISTLNQTNFYDEVTQILEKTRIMPSKLVIEVLEDEDIDDYKNISLNLNKLIQIGVRISLDDFGVGYSSFYRLLELNVSEIKIPREFFQNDFKLNLKNEKILLGIINMCKDMKIKIVAEGIENHIDADFVKCLGVNYIQGYHYSEPLNKTKFMDYLSRQN